MIAVSLAAAVVAATLGWTLRSVRRDRVDRRRRREVRSAVHLLVAELQAGGRPADVLAAAADAGRVAAFEAAARAAARGEDVASVLAADPSLVPVGVAWSVAARYGAPLADVLERVGADLDARDLQAGRVAALLAGPRASSALLTGMPALGLVLGSALGAKPLAFLFGTRAGQFALLGGVVLDAAGALWTGWLAARAQRCT